MQFESHYVSHKGMVRDSNQDSFYCSPEMGLFIVADGIGGKAGGEIASSMAVQVISKIFEENLTHILGMNRAYRQSFISETINTASLKIYEFSLAHPQYRGMGTTCTLLWIPPEGEWETRYATTSLIGHVGDSRCYLWRYGYLYQMTDDHSLINEQQKSGVLLKYAPAKNIITRCVGYQQEEEVDTPMHEIEKGDIYLLCSDGLSNKVEPYELSAMLSNKDLKTSISDLVNLANERGGEDNITLLGVKINL